MRKDLFDNIKHWEGAHLIRPLIVRPKGTKIDVDPINSYPKDLISHFVLRFFFEH